MTVQPDIGGSESSGVLSSGGLSVSASGGSEAQKHQGWDARLQIHPAGGVPLLRSPSLLPGGASAGGTLGEGKEALVPAWSGDRK